MTTKSGSRRSYKSKAKDGAAGMSFRTHCEFFPGVYLKIYFFQEALIMAKQSFCCLLLLAIITSRLKQI